MDATKMKPFFFLVLRIGSWTLDNRGIGHYRKVGYSWQWRRIIPFGKPIVTVERE